MAEGRRRQAWDLTSCLCALIFNKDVKRHQRLEPSDFNPYERPSRRGRLTRKNISRLKVLL